MVSAGAVRLATRRRRVGPDKGAAVAASARPSLAEAEAALAANDPQRFYEATFRLVQAAAAARCNRPAPGMTAGILEHDLRHAGSAELGLLAELFEECDAVRYGQSVRERQDMSRTFKHLQEVIANPG